jgi:hypothetical protein
MTTHPKREYTPEEIILRVLTALDIASGDSDPNIDPDMTDDEVRSEYPVVWSMQQLTSLASKLAAQKSDNAQLQYALEQSEAKWIAAQKREGVDGIQARYRVPGEDWSTWGAVFNAIKGTEMELRVVLNTTKNSCEHPSWEKQNNGKWRCACCGVIGEEQRYLQPDGEPDRIYSIAAQKREVDNDQRQVREDNQGLGEPGRLSPSSDQDREVSP